MGKANKSLKSAKDEKKYQLVNFVLNCGSFATSQVIMEKADAYALASVFAKGQGPEFVQAKWFSDAKGPTFDKTIRMSAVVSIEITAYSPAMLAPAK